jgi:uncharacterized protein DUF3291
VGYDLAQVNVSRLLAPLDSPLLADFMAALDEVNAAGDTAPGSLWRLQTEDGNATAVRAFGWDVAGTGRARAARASRRRLAVPRLTPAGPHRPLTPAGGP